MLSLPEAIDVVAAALALNRSVIAPAEVVRHGPLWIMRDAAPRAKRARNEEIFAYGASPDEVVRALRDYAPPGRYALEPFLAPDEAPDAVKAAYKAHGFRLSHSEPLFVASLGGQQAPGGGWDVRRVTSLEEAREVSLQLWGKATRKLRPEDLEGGRPAIRMYWVEYKGRAVAAARSLMPEPRAAWLHDVATAPEHRRRGIATALLSHVLSDDARLGASFSVLLASQAGSKLYPRLGYNQQALLQVYNPAPNR
jgi:GNAT superfamily N-acetyltransferase